MPSIWFRICVDTHERDARVVNVRGYKANLGKISKNTHKNRLQETTGTPFDIEGGSNRTLNIPAASLRTPLLLLPRAQRPLLRTPFLSLFPLPPRQKPITPLVNPDLNTGPLRRPPNTPITLPILVPRP